MERGKSSREPKAYLRVPTYTDLWEGDDVNELTADPMFLLPPESVLAAGR